MPWLRELRDRAAEETAGLSAEDLINRTKARAEEFHACYIREHSNVEVHEAGERFRSRKVV
jgi:hypothetical protein